MTTELPTLSSVPSNPKWYAREALRIAGPNLESICKALGIRVVTYPFDKAGTQALLSPCLDGGFSAIVSEHLIKNDPLQARMCVAHEAAHALFYNRSDDGVPPPRAASYPPTPEEEKFCDEFSAELLVLEDGEGITLPTEGTYE